MSWLLTALAKEILEENGSHAEDFTLKFNIYLPYNEEPICMQKTLSLCLTCLFLNRPRNNEVLWWTNPCMPKVHIMWSFSLHSNSIIQICLSCYSNNFLFSFLNYTIAFLLWPALVMSISHRIENDLKLHFSNIQDKWKCKIIYCLG